MLLPTTPSNPVQASLRPPYLLCCRQEALVLPPTTPPPRRLSAPLLIQTASQGHLRLRFGLRLREAACRLCLQLQRPASSTTVAAAPTAAAASSTTAAAVPTATATASSTTVVVAAAASSTTAVAAAASSTTAANCDFSHSCSCSCSCIRSSIRASPMITKFRGWCLFGVWRLVGFRHFPPSSSAFPAQQLGISPMCC